MKWHTHKIEISQEVYKDPKSNAKEIKYYITIDNVLVEGDHNYEEHEIRQTESRSIHENIYVETQSRDETMKVLEEYLG